MMNKIVNIHELIKLLEDNNKVLYGSTFYYENREQLNQYGIDDKRLYMLYARPLNLNTSETKYKKSDYLLTETNQYRMVLMFPDKFNPKDVLEIILSQIYMKCNVLASSCQTSAIFQAEFSKKGMPISKNLISIDIEIQSDIKFNCEKCLAC